MEAAYARTLYQWQDRTIERIRQKVQAEGTRVLQGGLGLFGSLNELRNELLNLRTRIANFGRGQLHDELARQGGRT